MQIFRLGSRNTFSMLMQKSMARKSCSTQAQPAFLYTSHTRDIDTEPSNRTNWKWFKMYIVSLVCYRRTDSFTVLLGSSGSDLYARKNKNASITMHKITQVKVRINDTGSLGSTFFKGSHLAT